MTQQKNQSYSISFSGTITFTSRIDGEEGYTRLLPDDSKHTESKQDNQNDFHYSIKNENKNKKSPKRDANQDCFGYIALSSDDEKIFKAFKTKDVRLSGFLHGENEHIQLYFNLAYYNELSIKNVFNARRLNKKLFKYETKRMLLVSPARSMRNEDDFLNSHTIVITEDDIFPLFKNIWSTDMFYKLKLRHIKRAYRKYIESISEYPYIEKQIPALIEETRGATKAIVIDTILSDDKLTVKEKRKYIAEMSELLSK